MSEARGIVRPQYTQSLTSVLNDPRDDAGLAQLWSVAESLYDVASDNLQTLQSQILQGGAGGSGHGGNGGTMSNAGSNAPQPLELPAISTQDFAAFISKHGEALKTFQNNHPMALGRGQAGALRSSRPAASNAVVELGSNDESNHSPQSSSQSDADAAALKQIPQEFFDSSFDLRNPQIFALAGVDLGSARAELLSSWLDVVDAQLLKGVLARSSEFFSSLDALRELQTDVRSALSTASTARQHLNHVDREVIGGSLVVARMARRKERLNQLGQMASQVSFVRQASSTVHQLLSVGDFLGSFEIINKAHKLLRTDLAKLAALQSTGPELQGLKTAVMRMMLAQFVQLASGREGLVDEAPREDSKGEASDKLTSDELQERQLLSIAVCMARTGCLSEGLQQWRDAAKKELKAAIRSVLTACQPLREGSRGTAGSQVLAEQIRSIEHSKFLQLMGAVYESLGVVLKRVRHVHDLVSAAVEAVSLQQQSVAMRSGGSSSTGGDSGAASAAELGKLQEDSKQALIDVCEAGHGRCARLLAVRAQQSSKLQPSDFAALFDDAVKFVGITDRLADAKINGLRATLMSQARSFVEAFHTVCVEKISLVLNQERWAQVQVPLPIQQICDSIVSGHTSVSADSRAHANDRDDTSQEKDESEGQGSKPQAEEQQPMTANLVIGGERLNCCGSTFILLKMIQDYLRCISTLPALGGELVHRCADLVRAFNSRSCQLVLGAGAVHTAGLRSITAKHLGICSQAVSALVLIIPSVRSAASDHLSERAKALLQEFDGVLDDLRNHRGEIFAKMVAIIADRASAHSRALTSAVPGGGPGSAFEGSGDGPSAWVQQLVKEVQAMHRVLDGTLPLAQVRLVFTKIIHEVSDRISGAMKSMHVPSSSQRQQLYVDLAHLLTSIRDLGEGVPDPGSALLESYSQMFGPLPG